MPLFLVAGLIEKQFLELNWAPGKEILNNVFNKKFDTLDTKNVLNCTKHVAHLCSNFGLILSQGSNSGSGKQAGMTSY